MDGRVHFWLPTDQDGGWSDSHKAFNCKIPRIFRLFNGYS
jgi:hypothetical protein